MGFGTLRTSPGIGGNMWIKSSDKRNHDRMNMDGCMMYMKGHDGYLANILFYSGETKITTWGYATVELRDQDYNRIDGICGV